MTIIVTNKQFWFCTLGIVIVWILVIATASENIAPAAESLKTEKEITRHCKTLCEHCNCLGFYCGEECICECNNEKSDTECIATMQDKARRLRMPFEILIQGPTSNNFVRNALQFEQNFERRHFGNTCHHKRSTVTIYKPQQQDVKRTNNIIYPPSNDLEMTSAVISSPQRSKRSTTTNSQFEWFSDISNNLVRPAPLGRRPKKSDESKTTTQNPKKFTTKSTSDKPWFMEYIPTGILTPAPLFKRSRYASSQEAQHRDDNAQEDEDSNIDQSSKSPLKLFTGSEAILDFGKDIVKTLGVSAAKVSSTTDDDGDEDKDDNKLFSKNIFKKRKITFKDTNDDDFQNSLEEVSHLEERQEPTKKKFTLFGVQQKQIADDKDEEETDFPIPWFRARNFFKRVQDVIKL